MILYLSLASLEIREPSLIEAREEDKEFGVDDVKDLDNDIGYSWKIDDAFR